MSNPFHLCAKDGHTILPSTAFGPVFVSVCAQKCVLFGRKLCVCVALALWPATCRVILAQLIRPFQPLSSWLPLVFREPVGKREPFGRMWPAN